MTDPIDLDALEALERKATEAPWGTFWWQEDTTDPTDIPMCGISGPEHFCGDGDDRNEIVCADRMNRGVSTYSNAQLMVALRNHARSLIAEARRARALERFALHPLSCTYFDPHPATAERPCSCGLSALLRKDGERG